MNKYVLSSLAAVVGAAGLQAQLQVDNLAGLGRLTTPQIDCDTLTGLNGSLGLTMLNGKIYLSSRGNNGGTAAPHTLTELDYVPGSGLQPTVTNTYAQDPATSGSAWGFRDGASDGQNAVMFGWEDGIWCFDPSNGMAVNMIEADMGPQPILNPIVEQTGTIGVHRAIAYDPSGNGGLGSIFVANFGSSVVEIDLAGNLLIEYQNNIGTSWSAYGLALDKDQDNPNGPTLWINSAPNAGEIREYAIDRLNMQLVETGRAFARGLPGTAQGGLEISEMPLDGRSSGYDLIGLDQGTPDSIYGYRIDEWDNSSSFEDGRLRHSIGAFAPQEGVLPWIQGVSSGGYRLQIDIPNPVGFPGVVYGVFGNQANPISFVPYGQGGLIDVAINELRLNVDLIGGTAFVQAPIPVVGGPPPSNQVQIPDAALNQPSATGLNLAWQGLFLDPLNNGPTSTPNPSGLLGPNGFPVGVTNVVGLEVQQPPFSYAVECNGANSFNADPSSGFFSIVNFNPGASIVSVTIDAFGALNGNNTMVFDTDQAGMADRFDGGNSTLAGCLGTYRNGSDVMTGLDYTGTAAAPCDPMALTGFTPSNIAAGGPQTITFNFAPGSFTAGMRFEWDMDTDLGLGITGAQMDGLIVTLVDSTGATLTSTITPVAGTTNFARAEF